MHWFPPACGGARGGDRREPFCKDIYNYRTIGYRLSAIGYFRVGTPKKRNAHARLIR